jgi:uncharacterized protein (DUF2141 family)
LSSAIEPKATLANTNIADTAPAALASTLVAPASSAAVDRSTPAATPAIRLVIAGVRPERGAIKVAVYNSESSFPNPERATQKFELVAAQTQIETTLRASGRFAVGVFQDINGDGELNRNRLGIPTEPFAFSNNVLGKRGPPSFDQAAIHAAGDSPSTVTINLP